MEASELSKSEARGAFVVIEGLDRAGKSTQCTILVNKLESSGHKTKYIRFPDRTTSVGKIINGYLRGEVQLDDHAIHLLFSANRWELASQIQEYIRSGVTVVVDRYSYSGAVYSAAKNNHDLSLEWAWQPEIGLPRPDVWFFLNLSPEEAEKRGGYGEERYENLALQMKVRQLFLSLQGLENNEEMRLVDANRSVDEVAEDLLTQVSEVMGRSQTPLRKLERLRLERQ